MNNDNSGISKLDYQLILELQEDPRRSNSELARRLGVSEATVRRRTADLVASGVITLTAVPNPFKLGYQTVAFIGLHAHPAKLDAVARRLVKLPDVHYVGLCSGPYDFLIWGFFETTEKLAGFIANELGQIPGMVKTETMIQMRYLKRTLGCARIPNRRVDDGVEPARLRRAPAAKRVGRDGTEVGDGEV